MRVPLVLLAHVRLHTHACVNMNISMRTHTLTHTHIHTRMYTHMMYTHTSTHTHTCSSRMRMPSVMNLRRARGPTCRSYRTCSGRCQGLMQGALLRGCARNTAVRPIVLHLQREVPGTYAGSTAAWQRHHGMSKWLLMPFRRGRGMHDVLCHTTQQGGRLTCLCAAHGSLPHTHICSHARTWYPTIWPRGPPSSAATRAAVLVAATLRGCVHPTQPAGAGREWKLFYA